MAEAPTTTIGLGHAGGGSEPRVEPLSFYVDLLRYPFAHASRGGGHVLSTLLTAISQAANVAGFLSELGRGRHHEPENPFSARVSRVAARQAAGHLHRDDALALDQHVAGECAAPLSRGPGQRGMGGVC